MAALCPYGISIPRPPVFCLFSHAFCPNGANQSSLCCELGLRLSCANAGPFAFHTASVQGEGNAKGLKAKLPKSGVEEGLALGEMKDKLGDRGGAPRDGAYGPQVPLLQSAGLRTLHEGSGHRPDRQPVAAVLPSPKMLDDEKEEGCPDGSAPPCPRPRGSRHAHLPEHASAPPGPARTGL